MAVKQFLPTREVPNSNSSGKRRSNSRNHDASCKCRLVCTNSVAQASADYSSSSCDQVPSFLTFFSLVCRYLRGRKWHVMNEGKKRKVLWMSIHPSCGRRAPTYPTWDRPYRTCAWTMPSESPENRSGGWCRRTERDSLKFEHVPKFQWTEQIRARWLLSFLLDGSTWISVKLSRNEKCPLFCSIGEVEISKPITFRIESGTLCSAARKCWIIHALSSTPQCLVRCNFVFLQAIRIRSQGRATKKTPRSRSTRQRRRRRA